jgi:hypothetical protein
MFGEVFGVVPSVVRIARRWHVHSAAWPATLAVVETAA